MDDHVEQETEDSNLRGYFGEADIDNDANSRPMNIRRQRRFEKTYPNQGSLCDIIVKRILYVLKSKDFSEYNKFDFQVTKKKYFSFRTTNINFTFRFTQLTR